jgi:repressor LexA
VYGCLFSTINCDHRFRRILRGGAKPAPPFLFLELSKLLTFGLCSVKIVTEAVDKMKNLTKRQREILNFIESFMEKHDYAPSYREIGEFFEYKSTATVAEHIEALEQKGCLKKDPTMARSLQLTPVWDERVFEIPLLGMIAAGEPIEAIRTSETIQIPKDMMGKDVFALKVRGDSMTSEGIFDGDYVIIQPCQVARNGEIVVALIDNENVTLKKFYKEKNHIRLEAANSKMKPMRFKKVLIQGKVKGVIRKFK